MSKFPILKVTVLGHFSVAAEGATPRSLAVSSRKGRGLLAYLALRPGRPATREQLAALLWADKVERQARQSLRQCLAALRNDLGGAADHWLATDSEAVSLRADRISVDALEFLSSAQESASLERAAELYRGELLADLNVESEPFDTWLLGERNRLGIAAESVFTKHIEQLEKTKRGSDAIAVAERLLALDPLREATHRTILRLYAEHAGPSTALTRAKQLARHLREELAVELEPETRALIDGIREGKVRRQAVDREQLAAAELALQPPSGTPDVSEAKSDTPAPFADVRSARSPWRRMWSTFFPGAAAASLAIVVLALVASLAASVLVPAAFVRDNATNAAPPHSSRSMADASLGRERGLVALAVLPFAAHGENGVAASMADMITDDLTTMLSRVSSFRVISRQTANVYRGQSIRAAAIGAELNVGFLIEGSVSPRAQSLRVNVGLTDTRTGLSVWSGLFERAGADQGAILDEIIRGLGRELQVEVGKIENESVGSDPNVHQLTVKGWAALSSRRLGIEQLRQAETHFQQALARDPQNVRAQNGLAAYHAHMAVQLFAADPAPHLAAAETILQRLIEKYPSLSGPHATMALVHKARGHTRQVIESLERAIALNPSHAPSYGQLGAMLIRSGRPQEALDNIFYAIRLSPRDPVLPFWLAFAGAAHSELGQYGKAIEYYERALALNPGQPRTVLSLVATHALSGNLGEARRLLTELQSAQPHLTREKLMGRRGGDGTEPRPWIQQGLRLALR